MTTMKDMIAAMDQIEGSVKSTSVITEASLNISANAETASEVGELLRVMQLGGVVHNDGSTSELPHMEPDGDEGEVVGPMPCKACGGDHGPAGPCGGDRDMMKRQLLAMDGMDDEVEEDYENEPEEEYHSMNDQMASGDDIHKRKQQFAKAQDGDNPMAVESIRQALELELEAKKLTNEKKKPDADGDGVPDWADKKPGKDDHAEDDEDDDK